MSMTRICYNPVLIYGLALLALCVCASVGYVQERVERTPWPRTFSGQPDFDFQRAEVLRDIQRTADTAEETVDPANFLDILQAQGVHPRKAPPQATEGGPSIQLPNLETAVDIGNGDLLDSFSNRKLNIQTTGPELDLTEFKAGLERRIAKAIATMPLYHEEVNARGTLSELHVSTIATAPESYVIINNQRLHVGDRLQLPVAFYPRIGDVRKAVAAGMPTAALVGEANLALYQAAKDEVLGAFVKARSETPQVYAQYHPIDLEILAIESQAILVDFLGQQHRLELTNVF